MANHVTHNRSLDPPNVVVDKEGSLMLVSGAKMSCYVNFYNFSCRSTHFSAAQPSIKPKSTESCVNSVTISQLPPSRMAKKTCSNGSLIWRIINFEYIWNKLKLWNYKRWIFISKTAIVRILISVTIDLLLIDTDHRLAPQMWSSFCIECPIRAFRIIFRPWLLNCNSVSKLRLP